MPNILALLTSSGFPPCYWHLANKGGGKGMEFRWETFCYVTRNLNGTSLRTLMLNIFEKSELNPFAPKAQYPFPCSKRIASGSALATARNLFSINMRRSTAHFCHLCL